MKDLLCGLLFIAGAVFLGSMVFSGVSYIRATMDGAPVDVRFEHLAGTFFSHLGVSSARNLLKQCWKDI